jgi:RNA polymerase sigma factor (sigma-70 family)
MAVHSSQLLYRVCQSFGAGRGLTPDAALLQRFAKHKDETAFELLLWRHGPMVWAACRRALGHSHDAEDAFQASFLALARKAKAIKAGTSLPGWLYRVAVRAALAASKKRMNMRVTSDVLLEEACSRVDDPHFTLARQETRELLDREISRLPTRLREAFVICDLEGRKQREAAVELGCPVGTIESRLNRARTFLRRRLGRRGLTLSASLVAFSFPATLRASTVLLATNGTPAGAAAVITLAEHALRSSTVLSPKLILAAAMSICVALVGLGQAAWFQGGKGQAEEAAQSVSSAPREKAAETPLDNDKEPLPKEALARVGSTRFRHGDIITSFAYSPDGKWVATASRDGTVRLWDANTGHLSLKVPLEGKEFPLVGFAREGKSLLVVDTKSARIIDLSSGKEQMNSALGNGNRVYGGTVAADGAKFLLVRDSSGIQVIDAKSGKELQTFSVPGKVAAKVDLAPDAKSAVVTTNTEKVLVLDLESGKTLHEFSDEQRNISAAVFSPDGKTLATLSAPKGLDKDRIVLWDLKTEKAQKQMDDVEVTGSCLAFSPDGKYVVTGSLQRLHLQLFDVATGKEVKKFRCWPSVLQLVFSPDGKTIAASKADGNLSLYDVKSGKPHPASPDVDGWVGHLHFTDGGKSLLTRSGDITIRDWKTGQVTRRYPDVLKEIFGAPVLSPDGAMMAAYDADGPIRLIDGKTGKEIRKLLGHTNFVHRAVFSPDGTRLFSRGYDHTLRIWDVQSGKELANLPLPNASSLDDLAISPDSRTLVTSSRESRETDAYVLLLWDVKSAVEVRRQVLPKLQFSRLAFSPDSTWVACVGGESWNDDTKPGAILLWNTATARLKALEAPSGVIFDVAFSPDGRTLATGGNDHMVRLWEIASGKERHCFRGHEGAVGSVTFSSDGALLASCSPDAPVFIWDMAALFTKNGAALQLTDVERKQLWEQLGTVRANEALPFMQKLIGNREQAIVLLQEGFRAEPSLDSAAIDQAISNLDSNSFDEREKATDFLRRYADSIEPRLRKALEKPASAEVELRLKAVLEKVDACPPEIIRQLRALEILERINTPEAHKLLEEIAKKNPGTVVADDAAQTLKRLKNRR